METSLSSLPVPAVVIDHKALLERQVRIGAELAQRCAMQASELAILTGINKVVAQNGDLAIALNDGLGNFLAMCFDAGGVLAAALYTLEEEGKLHARLVRDASIWTPDELQGFFGHPKLLRAIIARGRPELLTKEKHEVAGSEVLSRCGAVSALVLPLISGEVPLGALFLISRSKPLDDPDWLVLIQSIAAQLTTAVALKGSIDARNLLEASGLEDRAQLRAILDNAPDFITSVDRNGAVRFINRAFPQHALEQVVGSPWLSSFPPEQHAAMDSALKTVLATGQAATYESSASGLNGATLWFSSCIGPVRTGGEISGAVIIGRDVTEKRRTDAQLITSDRMAAVGILAAGVAHEINNPLAVLTANLDLTLRDLSGLTKQMALPSALEEQLRDARDCAERIRIIVRDLKIFSRSEGEKRGPVDTRQVLEATLRMASNEIRHRATLVEQYGDVPYVEANEPRLGQIFLNLIVNAAHSIPEGRAAANEIRVSTHLDPSGEVVVEVADTGAGMSPEVQRQLFTPFFTTKPLGAGTGLGLAICQRLVVDGGGRITFESTVGKGSVFRVHLPPARPHEATNGPPVAAAARRRGRILIVDDEAMLAKALSRLLSAEHDVVTTSRGREAIDLVAAGQRFDVILCDLMMPEVTGMDLHAALLQSAPDQAERMIFMTGGAFTASAREFLECVPNLRVEKPLDYQHFRALVNTRIQ